ncbi:MAG: hypothetical protein MHPDNHAH_03249 [Anaerolineales bacterium]|nr:hypothetical protein [Anaerolineales bacterium]
MSAHVICQRLKIGGHEGVQIRIEEGVVKIEQ